ncbi:MAG: ribosome small subunit-dependent GTPase A [Gemmatimonadota bacterium]|nr:ribosome small subunit-dependent GTPase A [Gemmatimonadota bacterium]
MTGPVGTVMAREGHTYRVAMDDREVQAVLRGKVKRSEAERKVVVGDRVHLDAPEEGGTWTIAAVEPRRNLLERRVPEGRGNRPVASNLDRIFVLTSAIDPEPVPQLVDRLLVLAEANEVPAAVIVNKIDLDPGAAIVARMRTAGYEVFAVSAETGQGLDLLLPELQGHVSLLTGPSGAGKSSLMNRIEPGLVLRTGAISEKVRRGKNTTVSAVMVPLAMGGFLVDTPGFSEVGLWGIEPRELASCFPEIRPLIDECKFADCRHLIEPACAVRAAVKSGTIQADRYDSYTVLLEELTSAPRDWE